MRQYLISQKTYDDLKNSLNGYIQEKDEIQQRIAETSYYGNLSENVEYLKEMERLEFVEEKIYRIGVQLSNSVVAKRKRVPSDKVGYGSMVRLYDIAGKVTEDFIIVEYGEAEPDKNEITMDSPIGKTVLNRKKGETVFVDLPSGRKKMIIKNVSVSV